jgi:copper transport protein
VTPRRWVRGGLLIAGLAALLLLARPATAAAHAEIQRADPPDLCAAEAVPRLRTGDPRCQRGAVLAASPSLVQIWFSEPVQPVAGGIKVLAPSGRRVDQGPPTTEGTALSVPVSAAEIGTYLVLWQVIAEDTHPARGQFAFSVGQESDPALAETIADVGGVSPLGLGLQVVARWLHFAGYALSFGVVVFWLLVPRPADPDARAIERRLWRLVNLGIVVLLIAEPVALLAQTGSVGSDQLLDPDAIGSALGSSFGRVWAQRLGAVLLLWALIGTVPAAPRRAGWAILGLGLALGIADGQAAHAANTRPVALGLLVNGLHLAAMGVWFGCVLGVLAVGCVPLADDRRQAMLARAGRLVGVALLTLVVTGSIMATQHLGGLNDLNSTGYGRALVAKLMMASVTLALAVPALSSRGRWTRRWRAGEALALLLVVGLASLLVSLPPRQ